MPEALIARRPLGTREDEALRAFGRAAVARITEQPLKSAFELQFDAESTTTAAALAAATGLELNAANRAVTAGALTALWLGPGNWLIKPGAGPAAALAALERAVAATQSSLVDVSDLWFGVTVEGERSRDLLSQGCALNLDPRAFPPGACAVTQLSRLRSLIHHVDGSPVYHVHVERSYARYLWAWLIDAMTGIDHEGDAG